MRFKVLPKWRWHFASNCKAAKSSGSSAGSSCFCLSNQTGKWQEIKLWYLKKNRYPYCSCAPSVLLVFFLYIWIALKLIEISWQALTSSTSLRFYNVLHDKLSATWSATGKFAQELKLMQHLTQSWQLALQHDPGPLTHGPRWRRPPLQALALFLYSYLLDSIHLLDLLSMCFQYAFISYDSYPSCTMINFDRKSLTLHILQDPNVHSSVAITPIADAWNLSFESLDTWNRIAETILKNKAIREDETHLVPISGSL